MNNTALTQAILFQQCSRAEGTHFFKAAAKHAINHFRANWAHRKTERLVWVVDSPSDISRTRASSVASAPEFPSKVVATPATIEVASAMFLRKVTNTAGSVVRVAFARFTSARSSRAASSSGRTTRNSGRGSRHDGYRSPSVHDFQLFPRNLRLTYAFAPVRWHRAKAAHTLLPSP